MGGGWHRYLWGRGLGWVVANQFSWYKDVSGIAFLLKNANLAQNIPKYKNISDRHKNRDEDIMGHGN